MIFVIDNDLAMAHCVTRAIKKVGKQARIFSNIIDAVRGLDVEVPEMIFLDILLTGDNGFTLLNELISYPDTAKVPVVIISSYDFSSEELQEYGVVATLNKATMLPIEIKRLVLEYARAKK